MTDEELKQFKDALSITAVARSLGIDVVRGKCRCAFASRHAHGDRTPSVSISEEKGYFRCWVCDDVRGDVISLVQKYKGCSFVEALNYLRETFPFLAPAGKTSSVTKSTPTVRSFMGPHHNGAAQTPQEIYATEPMPMPESAPAEELVSEDERKKIILNFLKMLSPVDGTQAAAWLMGRRIFKPVWDKMLLRTIKDYGLLNQTLKDTYSMDVLQYVGLFNEKGNLKFYKHPLIFPYLDTQRRAFYFQSRALESSVIPKEMNLRGTVPYPYNMSALDEKPGWVYLCEGVVDTLTFLGQKIDAVGIPGVRSFKVEWLPLFKNKNVVLCMDKDNAGREATKYLQEVFGNAGIRTIVLGEGMEHLESSIKEGEDVNDWFGGKR